MAPPHFFLLFSFSTDPLQLDPGQLELLAEEAKSSIWP